MQLDADEMNPWCERVCRSFLDPPTPGLFGQLTLLRPMLELAVLGRILGRPSAGIPRRSVEVEQESIRILAEVVEEALVHARRDRRQSCRSVPSEVDRTRP